MYKVIFWSCIAFGALVVPYDSISIVMQMAIVIRVAIFCHIVWLDTKEE